MFVYQIKSWFITWQVLKKGKVLYKWRCHWYVAQLCAYVIPSSDPSLVLRGVIRSESTILLFIWLTAAQPRQGIKTGSVSEGILQMHPAGAAPRARTLLCCNTQKILLGNLEVKYWDVLRMRTSNIQRAPPSACVSE